MSLFLYRLDHIQQKKNSKICVGLDPVPSRLPTELRPDNEPVEATITFVREIVSATHEYACAYKINFAFFEALGPRGMETIVQCMDAMPDDVLTIADAKRGDIGHSARYYARSIFDRFGFDSCTVSPYLGKESVEPFLSYSGKATFILGRTSNPGSDHIQQFPSRDSPLFLHVARHVHGWHQSAKGTAGLVAGATYPDDLAAIQKAAPGCPLLIPGIGAQGGNLEAVLSAALPNPILITSSRSIIYADDTGTLEDAADAARSATKRLRDRIANFS